VVIPSVPATFQTCDIRCMAVNIGFAIPAGNYISGYWTIHAQYTNVSSHIYTEAGITVFSGGGYHFISNGPQIITCDAQTMASINSAAGGNLPMIADGNGQMTNILSVTLTLNGTPATRRRADIYVY
jgi:ABC-type xylose transport system permease subunit